jgi:NAD(P)-dependent dehydrogenase (short-subunit alcohol dehydrogenase family)
MNKKKKKSKNPKVILISGCSRGLGRFLAEALAAKGFKIFAGIRKPQGIKRLGAVWRDSHFPIQPIRLDINIDTDCRRTVEKILADDGHIDVLINNAAYTLAGKAEKFSPQEYLNILDTNTVGAFRLMREVIPQMRRQGNGWIINITSLNGIVALPNYAFYSSSKFALEALALAMRYELKTSGIWVTNIEPGAIDKKEKTTETTSHISIREKSWIIKKLMPLVPEEKIAKTIVEIISDPKPPARIIIGRDARIMAFLQRFLPRRLWDLMLSSI